MRGDFSDQFYSLLPLAQHLQRDRLLPGMELAWILPRRTLADQTGVELTRLFGHPFTLGDVDRPCLIVRAKAAPQGEPVIMAPMAHAMRQLDRDTDPLCDG